MCVYLKGGHIFIGMSIAQEVGFKTMGMYRKNDFLGGFRKFLQHLEAAVYISDGTIICFPELLLTFEYRLYR